MCVKDVMLFIDPSHREFCNDELSKITSKWNRDRQFAPFKHLKKKIAKEGISTHTADCLLKYKMSRQVNCYVLYEITSNNMELVKYNSLLARMRLIAWFVLVVILLRPVARKLALLGMFPATRPTWLARLLRAGGKLSPEVKIHGE